MSQYLIGFLDPVMDPPFITFLLVLSTSNPSKTIHQFHHPELFIHHKVRIVNMLNSDNQDESMAQSEDGSVVGEEDVVGGAALVIAKPCHPPQLSAAEARQEGRPPGEGGCNYKGCKGDLCVHH